MGRLTSGILVGVVLSFRFRDQDQHTLPVTFGHCHVSRGDPNEKNDDGEKLLAAAMFFFIEGLSHFPFGLMMGDCCLIELTGWKSFFQKVLVGSASHTFQTHSYSSIGEYERCWPPAYETKLWVSVSMANLRRDNSES